MDYSTNMALIAHKFVRLSASKRTKDGISIKKVIAERILPANQCVVLEYDMIWGG